MYNIPGRLARTSVILALTWTAGAVGTAATAAGDPEHVVRYVVTADGGREVSIHYRVAAPSETSSGASYDQVWISPDAPWEQTTTLVDPYKYGYVSVRNIWWNPNFRCEVWVDGTLAMDGTGVCILTDRCRLAPCVDPPLPGSPSAARRGAVVPVRPAGG